MNRREAMTKIASVAVEGGFTFLDVIPAFPGVKPSTVEGYIQTAYKFGYIAASLNGLCYYPTQKLRNLKAKA